MPRQLEELFRSWAKPECASEQERCMNAERLIKEAIRESSHFSGKSIHVFAQGSYRNNTNIQSESDVDICVCCVDSIFPCFSFTNNLTNSDLDFVDSSYMYSHFKEDVEQALINKFGSTGVHRGNKAFDVHANSYRIDADVVACFEHRRYIQLPDNCVHYHSGTEFHPDNGIPIINWPQQHYQNGVQKNIATGNRYKYIVRGLKCLRTKMAKEAIPAALSIPSYLLECLVWNAPNESFKNEEYTQNMQNVLAYVFNGTIDNQRCHDWTEVNGLKQLFHFSQPWKRETTHEFISAAWDYIGFK